MMIQKLNQYKQIIEVNQNLNTNNAQNNYKIPFDTTQALKQSHPNVK